MKTKVFLLLCLLAGIGSTQLTAQNGNEVGRDTYYGYYVPVYSSTGDQIDFLTGDVSFHYVWHFHDGIWISIVASFYGEVTSVGFINNDGVKIGGTGEVFTIRDKFKSSITSTSNIGAGHFTAKGDQGSHYIIFYEYEYSFDGTNWVEIYTFVKAVSPGSKK